MLQANVFLEIRYKFTRHALLAPIHLPHFRSPKRDCTFMNRDELTFETLEFRKREIARRQGDAGCERGRRRGGGDVE